MDAGNESDALRPPLLAVGEAAEKHMEQARNELLLRLRLRDQVLLVHLVFVGAAFGAGFTANVGYELFLAIPFLALGFALIHGHHHCHLGLLTSFCANEIAPLLRSLGEPAPVFDDSETLRPHAAPATSRRSWATAIIFVVPCALALVVNWKYVVSYTFPMTLVWVGAAVCTGYALTETLRAAAFREREFARYNRWKK